MCILKQWAIVFITRKHRNKVDMYIQCLKGYSCLVNVVVLQTQKIWSDTQAFFNEFVVSGHQDIIRSLDMTKHLRCYRRHYTAVLTDWVEIILSTKLITANSFTSFSTVLSLQSGFEKSCVRTRTGHTGTKMSVSQPLTLQCSCRGQCWQCFSEWCYSSFDLGSDTLWNLRTKRSGEELHALEGFLHSALYWNSSLFWCVWVWHSQMWWITLTFYNWWWVRYILLLKKGGVYAEDEGWYNISQPVMYLCLVT